MSGILSDAVSRLSLRLKIASSGKRSKVFVFFFSGGISAKPFLIHHRAMPKDEIVNKKEMDGMPACLSVSNRVCLFPMMRCEFRNMVHIPIFPHSYNRVSMVVANMTHKGQDICIHPDGSGPVSPTSRRHFSLMWWNTQCQHVYFQCWK